MWESPRSVSVRLESLTYSLAGAMTELKHDANSGEYTPVIRRCDKPTRDPLFRRSLFRSSRRGTDPRAARMR